MKNAWEKIKEHPIWSGVTAIVIGAILIDVVSDFKLFLPLIVDDISLYYEILTTNILVPYWAYLFIYFLLLYLFLLSAKKVYRIYTTPDFFKYTEDKIFGLKWTWHWAPPTDFNNDPSINNLKARCPECKSLIEYDRYSSSLVNCPNLNCDYYWDPGNNENEITLIFLDDERELLKLVKFEIDRVAIDKYSKPS